MQIIKSHPVLGDIAFDVPIDATEAQVRKIAVDALIRAKWLHAALRYDGFGKHRQKDIVADIVMDEKHIRIATPYLPEKSARMALVKRLTNGVNAQYNPDDYTNRCPLDRRTAERVLKNMLAMQAAGEQVVYGDLLAWYMLESETEPQVPSHAETNTKPATDIPPYEYGDIIAEAYANIYMLPAEVEKLTPRASNADELRTLCKQFVSVEVEPQSELQKWAKQYFDNTEISGASLQDIIRRAPAEKMQRFKLRELFTEAVNGFFNTPESD